MRKRGFLPEKLRDWLVSKAITISFVPTPLAEKLLLLDWSNQAALRILLTGGDKLHQHPLLSLLFRLSIITDQPRILL
jgi:hypothetical protein